MNKTNGTWTRLTLVAFLVVVTGCSSPASPSGTAGTSGTSGTSTQAITFDTSHSVGLALTQTTNVAARSLLRSESTVPRSNLQKVDSSGNLSDVLSSGSALISKFMIAPNGKIYVLFSQKTNVATSTVDLTNGCLLAEVDSTSGHVTAIDTTLSAIDWNDSSSYFRNQPIQFDSQGAIYYKGTSGSASVLRKYLNATTTDLVNDNIAINDYIVNSDGSVFLIGTTTSTSNRWLRKVSSTGVLTSIQAGLSGDIDFIKIFPDQNLYFGSWSPIGIMRYLTASSALDSQFWTAPTAPATYVTPATVPYSNQINDIYTILASKVYGLYSNSGPKTLVQLYPGFSVPSTIVVSVTVAKAISSNLVLAGLDSASKNRMVLFNTTDGSETDLLAGHDIEVYHISYNSLGNKVIFDGLDFATNLMVIGTVDLGTIQVVTTSIGTGASAKLSDFQGLN